MTEKTADDLTARQELGAWLVGAQASGLPAVAAESIRRFAEDIVAEEVGEIRKHEPEWRCVEPGDEEGCRHCEGWSLACSCGWVGSGSFFDHIPNGPMGRLYARLAAEYEKHPAVPDLGGGLKGDLYPL